MTTQHIDVDSPEFEDAPKALRDAFKKLQKEHQAAVAQRDTFRTQVHAQALETVLKDQGFKNPKRVQKDLLADEVDPLDKDAVSGWLAEFGDDYAKGQAPQSAEPQQQPDPNAQQLSAIQQVSGESTPSGEASAMDRAMAEYNALGRAAGSAEWAQIAVKHGL